MNRTLCLFAAFVVAMSAGPALAQDATQAASFADTFGVKLDEWLPGMGAETISQRRNAQQALQNELFKLGGGEHKEDLTTACKIVAGKLGPETSKPARLWLLRQLEFNGSAECVDAVAACLKDKDATIRDAARRALQNNPARAAGAKLLAALASAPDDTGRIAVANALGYRGEPDAEKALAGLLSHKNADVAAAAANALGRIATPDAAKALAAALDKAPDGLISPIADAYLRCADAMLDAGKKPEAMAVYRRLAAGTWPSAIRLAAAQGMLKAAGKK